MKLSVACSVLLAVGFFSSDLLASGKPPGANAEARPAAASSSASPDAPFSSQFTIPGPQRSFLRMAGISQGVAPEEVLPMLSRNVFTEGYEGSAHPTEFLVLVRRYVEQARELAALASQTGMVLRVSGCSDATPLLRILGYRIRPDCGEPNTSLQTDDPERAFLAIDSGFPLPALEAALQGGKPFEYPYASDPVPVQFAESDWTVLSSKNVNENSRDLLGTMLYDHSVARLYWALSRLDPQTRKFLQQSVGLRKLLPYAAVLDFYGRELCVSDGKVLVPGGQRAVTGWKELVGADPASAQSFIPKLIAKDKGWLAAYFDVLSRTSGKQQEYFTDPRRLRLFYNGLLALDPLAPATRGVFRPAPWLLLLVTRIQFDDAGRPLIPGNLAEWNDIVFQGRDSKLVRRLLGHSEMTDADQLIKVLFALSRSQQEATALQFYVAMSELDSRRAAGNRLAPATVRLLTARFEDFSAQYRIFSEFPQLNDKSITRFIQVAHGLNNLPHPNRGNAFGILQANIGIWQILARQGEISSPELNTSWQRMIEPFATVRSAIQVYDAARNSLAEIYRSSTGKPVVSQDKIIELLAGPEQSTSAGKQMQRESAARIRAVLDDQRLVSLDTIMAVGDALKDKAQGKRPEEYAILLAGQTREFEMPRPIFSMGEREEWAAGVYNNHHTDLQMKTDLPKLLKSGTASVQQLEEARGHLASFLRDTLVGLNYAYYEPPGAQALHNNPLLVRSHDFAGETVEGMDHLWQEPQLFGQGSPAGGGAHFVGSLAGLPLALASLEEDFISPSNVQALIWTELTPELLTNAILPRWWDVSPLELHAIGLYQRCGEDLLTASVQDQALREKVLAILSDRLLRQHLKQVEQELSAGSVKEVVRQMMPADAFYLGLEFREKYSEQLSGLGAASQELEKLAEQHPDEFSRVRLARDFGIPHPSLAQNYGLELLSVMPMPPFAGYGSRLFAESWDSPNLYWARLADERGYPPVILNSLVPQLTRRMVEKVFATDLEDWAALLRALHDTGDDFLAGKVPTPAVTGVRQP